MLICVIVLIILNDLAAASWGPPWFKLLLVDLLFHCSTSHRHILWRCEICHYFFGLTLQPWNFSSPLNIQELRTTSSSRRLKKAFRKKYVYIYIHMVYIYIYIWFISLYIWLMWSIRPPWVPSSSNLGSGGLPKKVSRSQGRACFFVQTGRQLV